MADRVKTCYPNGTCPDCGRNIPDVAVEGEECSNCGHVFWMYEDDDDFYDDDWQDDEWDES